MTCICNPVYHAKRGDYMQCRNCGATWTVARQPKTDQPPKARQSTRAALVDEPIFTRQKLLAAIERRPGQSAGQLARAIKARPQLAYSVLWKIRKRRQVMAERKPGTGHYLYFPLEN